MFYTRTAAGRGITFFATLFLSLLSGIQSHAYTLTQTPGGQNIRWHYGQKFFIAGNSTNQSGLSPSDLWNAVVSGLQQWNRATQGMFDFDYWQGTDRKIYETGLSQSGLNAIFYASNSSEKSDPNVIGFTQVWFNSNTGDLMEADIMLNDRDYLLTNDPTDTSSKRVAGGKPKVYLNNVVTHELGHAIGLSHSSSINSSMLYVEFSEQAKLGCDDWAAASHLYPVFNNGMGSLTGTILSPHSEPVAGAVVTAISISRGVPIAAVHTDQNGQFHFGALEAGDVSLMVEEYLGTPASIPSRLRAKTSQNVCENNHFPKNFINEDHSNGLRKFRVTAGVASTIGTYRINCKEVSESSPSPSIVSVSSDVFVDRGAINTSKIYTFNANGPFEITGLGYLLLSPVKVALSAFDASGSPLPIQTQSPLYQSKDSTYDVQDTSLSGTAFGTITVRADISTNDISGYPAPAIFPNINSPFFVIVFNNSPIVGKRSNIPYNARCSSGDPYPSYQSPHGNPIRNATTTTTRDNIGFCGNAQASSFREGAHFSSPTRAFPSWGGLIGWALPFLAAIACQLFLRLRRAKL